MKCRGVQSLPSSVALWLEQQLEERGIDRFYSKFIFNLLQCDADLTDIPELLKGKGLEGLVNELCIKLKQADKEGNKCLKETTNSEDLFNIELPFSTPNLTKYYSVFPALPKEFEHLSPNSVWSRNFGRRLGKKQDSEGSPKGTKRKENKENVCGVIRSRMRSRSTVKQSGGSHHKMRSSAKSLDRKDDEAVVRYVKNEIKGRKCLNFLSDDRENCIVGGSGGGAKLSRTPGRREKIELTEFDQDLPMDFQQLLQSPDDSSLYKHPKQNQPASNFIQCGTNITSSIWSELTGEKMEEEEVPVWEMSKWSEARSSILSSAWKLPFVYEKDVESTALALADEGSFFSFFGSSNLLNHTKNSGFTEVLPGQGQEETKKSTVSQILNEVQDEDLLTSMKTHFRPIKHEGREMDSQGYIDGSTFLISTSFEQVDYRRSESGGLYLGSENKYYEFKRCEPSLTPSGFVPKFKVRQNEKFCQTEEEEQKQPECERNGASDFYFPGDDQLAEDMVNCTEEDQPTIQVSGWVTTWPVSVSSAIWSNNSQDNHKPWILDLGNAKVENEEMDGRNEHYARLRNELTEEGEELLSDLSSIHLFLDSERMDDSSLDQLQHRSPKMDFQPYPIKSGKLSNDHCY